MSRSVFTSYERDLAKAAWASNSARLTRDSYLPFGSCYLCLEQARDPVSCSHGDLFCRECAISNLLAQKKEIKRMARAREKAELDLRDAVARKDEEAQRRAINDFETIQAGFTSKATPTTQTAAEATSQEGASTSKQTSKRKAIFDEDEVERLAQEERSKARKILDQEMTKDRLPSFWTPSQTPGTDVTLNLLSRKPTKTNPICPASSESAPHSYSLKGLTPVKFSEEADPKNSNDTRRVCPLCVKTLGNASRPLMATECGHVLCRTCASKLLTPAKGLAEAEDQACLVCSAKLIPSKQGGTKHRKEAFPGMIELRSEGTGFSARGANKVEKQGTAFQC